MRTFLSFIVLAGLVFGMSQTSFAQILDSPRDGVYDKIHTAEKKPIPYYPVREADVAWKKRIWRTMDLRQKINHPFYYPETPKKEWKNFMTVIMDAIREGSVTAYDPTKDDQFLVPLTYQEIEKKFSSIDTVPVYDPNNPQRILRYDVIKEDFDPAEVQRLNLKEDWFFDKQRSVMDVRILGICPIRNVYDENDNFIGFEEMFWIYFPKPVRYSLSRLYLTGKTVLKEEHLMNCSGNVHSEAIFIRKKMYTTVRSQIMLPVWMHCLKQNVLKTNYLNSNTNSGSSRNSKTIQQDSSPCGRSFFLSPPPKSVNLHVCREQLTYFKRPSNTLKELGLHVPRF